MALVSNHWFQLVHFCKSKLFLIILISHITHIMKKCSEMQMIHSKLISISILFKLSDQHFASSIAYAATVFDLDKKWPLN